MITLKNLHVRLSEFFLDNISLDISEGEFFVLMGPTGSGKTVLLEAIAGLIPVTRGQIFIQEKEVTGLPPEKRGIGIVYQDQALFPHLTVRKNIAYGLRYHRISGEIAVERIDRLVSLLNLSHLLDRLPGNLSGGEKQRVALARALAVRPEVLLLDEPLSALDPNFREEVRNALKSLHRNTGTTFMMVTHDFVDALSLGDRAAVINNGHIEQAGPVDDIFQKPMSAFVANFVGMKNLFKARFEGTKTSLGDLEIELGRKPDNGQGHIAIRPEDILITRDAFSSTVRNMFKGKVAGVFAQGFTYEVHIRAGETVFKSLITQKALSELAIQEGEAVSISFPARAIHNF
ncbi:ABC transporter ATP-binding protein [Desulfonema magnum]|uniref:Molybdate/tungstate import ATP-binding protein n=1 Tax=Desulfonema magnum TaxID=45655 RepID=A0A975GLS0_9BACT|nr:ABC transporter ATP-binding protein [Desulfonema magnum]QTA86067.1 Molybdate/tungstate import ATP-binding protein [Desulfonema magnum]